MDNGDWTEHSVQMGSGFVDRLCHPVAPWDLMLWVPHAPEEGWSHWGC